jgi:hypothetical protein
VVKEDKNLQFFIRETESGTIKVANIGSFEAKKEFFIELTKPFLKNREVSNKASQINLFEKRVYIFFGGGLILIVSIVFLSIKSKNTQTNNFSNLTNSKNDEALFFKTLIENPKDSSEYKIALTKLREIYKK